MKRILLTGAPGTGKTTVIEALIKHRYYCLPEISRSIILEGQQKGVDQLFLTDPNLFNNRVLEGRIEQFESCTTIDSEFVFFDRGLPDIMAYNTYVNETHDERLMQALADYRYDEVFVFPPWQKIYQQDNERYESFNEATTIHHNIITTLSKLQYQYHLIPLDSITTRVHFIIATLNSIRTL